MAAPFSSLGAPSVGYRRDCGTGRALSGLSYGRLPERFSVKTRSSRTPSAPGLGDRVRPSFPILHQTVYDKPLVYLDSAASSQKPLVVIEALDEYYRSYNANVHRGVHALSAKATTAFEDARDKVAKFVNAASHKEIVFTRNASEAINLVAQTWAATNLKAGDEIVVSVAEHHSNLVPWQMIAQRTQAVIRPIGLTETEELDVDELARAVNSRTKLIAVCHISNTLGCVTPIDRVAEIARNVGAKLLVDACQSVPNRPVDVQTLGADWIVASGHKMCAPTGIGFLWGRLEVLESMPPWMGGGEMINEVFLDHSTYAEPPLKFEAGTPAIAQAIGLGVACDYLSGVGMGVIHAYEQDLSELLYDKLRKINGIRIYGPPPSVPGGRAALASFNVDGIHPTDLSTILDYSGFAVRSGHMCTQPLLRSLGTEACIRASAYLYSTRDEIEGFVSSLEDAISFLS